MNNEKNNTPVIGFNTQSKIDAEGKEKPFLIQQLTVRPLVRKSHDISTLLRAIRAAESLIPRRLELYDLYEDFLSTDAHLFSVTDKLVKSITNVDWGYVDATGQEVEKMNEFIDSPAFESIVEEVMKSKLWGYTMIDVEFEEDGTVSVFVVPRKHMRPKLGIIATNQTGDTGTYIREGVYADTVLEAGKEDDLGLLMIAAPYVIFKRCSLTDWGEFAEVFGRPIIDAVWDGFDEDQKIELTKALDQMGGGGQIVRPSGTTLTLLPGATNNPTGELYRGIYEVCNDELSKLFLGNTETTESSDSSGYAQASVHQNSETELKRSYKKFVRRILNKRLLNILEKNGFIPEGGKFIIKGENEEKLGKKDSLEIDIKLRTEAGIPISDDHFYEKYGIEKPADYEEQKARMAAEKAAQQMGGGFNMTQLSEMIKLRDSGFFDEPQP